VRNIGSGKAETSVEVTFQICLLLDCFDDLSVNSLLISDSLGVELSLLGKMLWLLLLLAFLLGDWSSLDGLALCLLLFVTNKKRVRNSRRVAR